MFADAGSVYAVYLPSGTSPDLRLEPGNYSVRWCNPRAGGSLQEGSVTSVEGAARRSLGNPPQPTDSDWVVLVERNE